MALFFWLLFSATLTVVFGRTSPPTYILNLDLPEEDRFSEIAKDFKNYADVFAETVKRQIPLKLLPLVLLITEFLETFIPVEYAKEMKGLAKNFELPLSDIVGLNIWYELKAYCTSIVACDKNGAIWHARNLDFKPTDLLRNITINIIAQKQGKVVFSGTTFPACVGLVTGQKPNNFTISINERDKSSDWWLNALVAIVDRKAWFTSLLVRDVLSSSINFEAAILRLEETDLIAPVYFTVGGLKSNEGVVITRKRLGTADSWYLDVSGGRWFLVETNYDHWLPPPSGDDRRTPAMKAMNATKVVNETNLLQVLSIIPVCNNFTVYSTIMSASKPDVFQSWIIDTMKDCH